MSKRETQKKLNTLACVAVGLIGYRTTIELYNDAYVIGKLVDADAMMNIEMVHAKYVDGNGEATYLQNFHVMGRKIRYIHIPEEIDVLKLIKKVVEPKPKKVQKPTVRQMIIMKRDQQTLNRFHRRLEQQQKEQEEQQPGPSGNT